MVFLRFPEVKIQNLMSKLHFFKPGDLLLLLQRVGFLSDKVHPIWYTLNKYKLFWSYYFEHIFRLTFLKNTNKIFFFLNLNMNDFYQQKKYYFR